MNLSYLKEHLSLSEVADKLGVRLLPRGSQDCIFCNRSKKLTIKDDKYFKCYHPACGKQGSVVDLVIFKGLVTNPKEAFHYLLQFLDGEDKEQMQVAVGYEQKRCSLLERVLACYQEGLEENDEILDTLNQRGYCNVLEEIPIGFAKGKSFLRDRGFSTDELMLLGFINTSTGDEFFRDRIIFPIRNHRGYLVHLQGRAIDPTEKIRWLSSPSGESIPDVNWRPKPISEFIFEIHKLQEDSTTFLTEGISDCLSLMELELNSVACFGVEVDLARHANSFSKLNRLIAFLDNDVYPIGNPYAGEYKSWRSMLPRLIELKEACPKLEIWCAMPPNKSGIKDANEWITTDKLSSKAFIHHIKQTAKPLESFVIDQWSNDIKKHYDMLRLISIDKNPLQVEQLRERIEGMTQQEFDWLDYCLKIVRVSDAAD